METSGLSTLTTVRLTQSPRRRRRKAGRSTATVPMESMYLYILLKYHHMIYDSYSVQRRDKKKKLAYALKDDNRISFFPTTVRIAAKYSDCVVMLFTSCIFHNFMPGHIMK